jgi:hypothetical protein
MMNYELEELSEIQQVLNSELVILNFLSGFFFITAKYTKKARSSQSNYQFRMMNYEFSLRLSVSAWKFHAKARRREVNYQFRM